MGIKFGEFNSVNEGTVMLVDGLNIAFRYKEYDVWSEDFIRTVKSLGKSYKAGRIVILSDWGNSAFRKNLHPGYKQGRRDKYETQTEEDREKFARFFEHWEQVLKDCEAHFPVIRFQGVEADDLAGYIVKNKKKYGIEQIWLISSDKDWDLLIQEGVCRFSHMTRKETTLDNWHEHYECEQEDYAHLKALMGDSGDSIPGVVGLGPKRSLALIKHYGSVFDIIDSMPIPGHQKFIAAVNQSKDLLELNLQLVDILTYCEEAIGADNTKVIDNLFNGN